MSSPWNVGLMVLEVNEIIINWGSHNLRQNELLCLEIQMVIIFILLEEQESICPVFEMSKVLRRHQWRYSGRWWRRWWWWWCFLQFWLVYCYFCLQYLSMQPKWEAIQQLTNQCMDFRNFVILIWYKKKLFRMKNDCFPISSTFQFT